jgi:hypothetical protein
MAPLNSITRDFNDENILSIVAFITRAKSTKEAIVGILALKGFFQSYSDLDTELSKYIISCCELHMSFLDLTLIRASFANIVDIIQNYDQFQKMPVADSSQKRKRSGSDDPELPKKKRERSLCSMTKKVIHQWLLRSFGLQKRAFLMTACNTIWGNMKKEFKFDPKNFTLEQFTSLLDNYHLCKTDFVALLNDLDISLSENNHEQINALKINDIVHKNIILIYNNDSKDSSSDTEKAEQQQEHLENSEDDSKEQLNTHTTVFNESDDEVF